MEVGQVFSGHFSFHLECSLSLVCYKALVQYRRTEVHHTLRIKESCTGFLSRRQTLSVHNSNSIPVFQKEIQQLVNTPSRDTTHESYNMADGKAMQGEISNLQKQLKICKNEADKLRDQLSKRYGVATLLRGWERFVLPMILLLLRSLDIHEYYKCR